jgi:hypothetical protein
VAEPDREILEQPGVLETLIASLTEAFREGYRGAALDGTLLAGRPWGIPLHKTASKITGPHSHARQS